MGLGSAPKIHCIQCTTVLDDGHLSPLGLGVYSALRYGGRIPTTAEDVPSSQHLFPDP